MKKRKDKLEVELLEARALSVSATRNVERLERYEGEGASEDEEEGKLTSDCLGIARNMFGFARLTLISQLICVKSTRQT